MLKNYTLALFKHLTVVPNLLISTASYYEAFQLCKDVDEKDMVYVALAIALDLPLLTRDNALITGLAQHGFSQTLRFSDRKRA